MSNPAEPRHPPLLVVGGGAMATAILRGAAAAGVLDPCLVAVAEPVEERWPGLQGVAARVVSRAGGAVEWLRSVERSPGEGQVLLAVKPQMLGEAAKDLEPCLDGPVRVVISIMAGKPSERILEVLGGRARVVRVMPNLPAQIGRGMTAIARGAGAVAGDERFAERLFTGVGKTIAIPESMMDAFTALAGSGPAYIFYLAEAMVAAGAKMGFNPEEALGVVAQTVAGAGLLLAESAASPGALRQGVASKGGTTAAAMDVLDGAKVRDEFVRAILAARGRGAELAGA